MTDDRLMVAEAVFAGLIGEEHLTQDEIDEMFELLCDAAIDQVLDEARQRGCNVFIGYENEMVH